MTIEDIFGKLNDSERRAMADALIRKEPGNGKLKPVGIRKDIPGGYIEASAFKPLEKEDIALLFHLVRHAENKGEKAMDGIIEGKIRSSEVFELMPYWQRRKSIGKIEEAVKRLIATCVIMKCMDPETKKTTKEYRRLLMGCCIKECRGSTEIGFAVDKSLAESLFEGTADPFEPQKATI